jgi:hypothetical protein
MDNLIKEALDLGKINTRSRNGKKLWGEFVRSHNLTDWIIGHWILVTKDEMEIIKKADKMNRNDPLWLDKYFESQIYRIRLEKPASAKRIAQIAFSWTSSGNNTKFIINRFIRLF